MEMLQVPICQGKVSKQSEVRHTWEVLASRDVVPLFSFLLSLRLPDEDEYLLDGLRGTPTRVECKPRQQKRQLFLQKILQMCMALQKGNLLILSI